MSDRVVNLYFFSFNDFRKVTMQKIISLFSVAAFLFFMPGCDSKPPVSNVTGKVTIKGSPAPEKTRVTFEPVGAGQLATGMVDASGNYKLYYGNEGLEGALPGSYKVVLSPDSSGSDYMSGKPSGVPGVPSAGPIPKEYLTGSTSPLTVEVPDTDTTIDVNVE